MTDEQKATQFGRAAYDLKAAETDLKHTCAKAEAIASEFGRISRALTARVKAAEVKATLPSMNQDEPLRLGRVDVPFDLAGLSELDSEISAAVVRVATAREQYEKTKP